MLFMKKSYCSFILLMFSFAFAFGQTKTTKKAVPMVSSNTPHTIDYYMDHYLFSEAETQLQRMVTQLKKKKQADAILEDELTTARKGKTMLVGTQKVAFIDSFVVDRNSFLEKYKLSKEAGRIANYDNVFGTHDSTDCFVYITAMGNKCYLSQPTLNGSAQLCSSDLIGGKWNTPTPLEGLHANEIQNYPFLLSDGITLYYAADGKESLGGYDIFVTRYNSDTKKFLKPENIGMPFNSPANDYMYAIDELNNLGWFVSDRNQPDDKVCIYVFIPTPTREVYDFENENKVTIARAARIASIVETWADKNAVQQARTRLQELLNAQPVKQAKSEYTFVINDNYTYTKDEDFHSPEARKMIAWWKESNVDLQKNISQLEAMRDEYAKSNQPEKRASQKELLQMEQKVEALKKSISEQEKKIRNTEINALNSRIN
jgi:hypothetical protein